jgi:hypothetical protein
MEKGLPNLSWINLAWDRYRDLVNRELKEEYRLMRSDVVWLL